MYERWMEHASCADFPREVFFPTDGGGVVRAQKICATCPVAKPCLEYALTHRVEHGVWGGCSERKRRRILSARKRKLTVAELNGHAQADIQADVVIGATETPVGVVDAPASKSVKQRSKDADVLIG